MSKTVETYEELSWQEKMILQKAQKIRELFISILNEQGERPDGEEPLLSMAIFPSGHVQWFSFKEDGDDEEPVYYTSVSLNKEDYDEGTGLHS